MDVLLNSFWTGTFAPWLANILSSLDRIDSGLWAVIAAFFIVVAAFFFSVAAARGARARAARLAERLATEQQRQKGAVESLQNELWTLADELNRVKSAGDPVLQTGGDDGLRYAPDDGKLTHITDLLERLTEQERDRRQQVAAIEAGLGRVKADVEGLRTRLAEREAAAAGQIEAYPVLDGIDAASGAELARLTETLAQLTARFERMDALIVRLSQIRVD